MFVKKIKLIISQDKLNRKFLMQTHDHQLIEAGYYTLDEHILCLSSQIGCPMKCLFCASGESFTRNLSAAEIVSQAENILAEIKDGGPEEKGLLFSFMGMGEPFLNYENLVKSLWLLGYYYPNSRMTISTLGTRPELMKNLARLRLNNTLKLHLSLHAPNDELRRRLLPQAGNIRPALDALAYFSSVRKVSVKVNYVLINKFNDSRKQAFQLAKLLKPYPFIVKLSCLNEINGFTASSFQQTREFETILDDRGIKTCRFFSSGAVVKAGCGQFRRAF